MGTSMTSRRTASVRSGGRVGRHDKNAKDLRRLGQNGRTVNLLSSLITTSQSAEINARLVNDLKEDADRFWRSAPSGESTVLADEASEMI